MIRSFLTTILLAAFSAGPLRAEIPASAEAPKAADAAPVALADADGPPEHQGSRRVVPQGDDGVILLHARDASVHGGTLRYEPIEAKNTIGYWFKLEDWVSWEFTVAKAGEYSVEVLQGCGKGDGGGNVEVSAGGKVLPFVVEDTGGFQNFKARVIGTVTLAEGKQTLAIKARTRPGVAVVDIRQVTLRPAEAKP